MPTLTIEYTTDSERLQYERAIAYVQELNRIAATAAPGTVLDTCEVFALEQGRKVLRDTLADTLQARVDAAPKKSPTTARKGRNAAS
jgi:hypothetical protein